MGPRKHLEFFLRRWKLMVTVCLVILLGQHFILSLRSSEKIRYAATSKVIIAPEATKVMEKIPVMLRPPYQPFMNKLRSLTEYPVLRRGAELIVGERPFESVPFHKGQLPEEVREGSALLRARFGSDEVGLQRWISLMESSTRTVHVPHKQIVNITVVADDPLTARMMSWAIAEAGYQFHRARIQRSHDEYLVRLGPIITDAEAALGDAREEVIEVESMAVPGDADIRQSMIIRELAHRDERLGRVFMELQRIDHSIREHCAEQSSGGRKRRPPPDEAYTEVLEERIFDTSMEFETQRATLSSRHPEVQETERVLWQLARESYRPSFGERRTAARTRLQALVHERTLLTMEQTSLHEQKAALRQRSTEIGLVQIDVLPKAIVHTEAEAELASLRSLERSTIFEASFLPRPVHPYDPASTTRRVIRKRAEGAGAYALASLMSIVAALMAGFIVDRYDTRVRVYSEARKYLKAPFIGSINNEWKSERLLTNAPVKSEISERYTTAAAFVQTLCRERNLKTLAVCSSGSGEGRTTVAIDMALAMVRRGARVLLVDADLRNPAIHDLLRLGNPRGVAQLLEEKALGASAAEAVFATGVEKLSLLASGRQCDDTWNLFTGDALTQMLAEVTPGFDFVIVDSPALDRAADALTIASSVDGCLFVVGVGEVRGSELQRASELLQAAGAHLVGVLLNKDRRVKGPEYAEERESDPIDWA